MLNPLSFEHAHPLTVLVAYIIITNAIGALPSPTATSNPFYTWFFTFSHAVMLQAGRLANQYLNKQPIESSSTTTTTTVSSNTAVNSVPVSGQADWKPFPKKEQK
jgi:hypothetical protein